MFYGLRNIKQPREVKELLHKQVEKMKIERRMRVGEILEDSQGDCDHFGHTGPDEDFAEME